MSDSTTAAPATPTAQPGAPVPIPSPWGPVPVPPGGIPGRRPDAVQIPAGILTGTALTKALTIKSTVGPILGCAIVHTADQGTFNFCRPDPFSSLLYPKGHALESKPRYTWLPATDGSGVLFGYLLEPPTP